MFPTNPEEFDADDRISFSRVSNTFILETEDGREFQWDQALKRWAEDVDDDEVARQQEAYAVQGVDESEPAANPRRRRRQARDEHFEEGRQSPAAKRPRKPGQADSGAPARERKNTAVYVTNLPADATADEVEQAFSRCGVIAEEIDSGRPRIKLYEDAHGRFKGDALVVYFRPESVALAIQLLDDTDFRIGQTLPSGRMGVVEADRTYKRQNNDGGGGGGGGVDAPPSTAAAASATAAANNGSGSGPSSSSASQAPAPDAKSRQQRERDKKKVIARTAKLNARLADWDDDDDNPSALTSTASSRWDKVVVLKGMFTAAELEADPAAILDIKEDIRDECAKLGEVTNVVLYDGEPDGVASVRFSEPAAARACVAVMHGRWFAATQITAYVSTGERFRKSNRNKADADQDDDDGPGWEEEEDMQRAERFGAWIEENDREEVVDREDDVEERARAEAEAGPVDPEKS